MMALYLEQMMQKLSIVRTDPFWLGMCLALMVGPLARGADLSHDFIVDVWTLEEGLPHSSVKSIAQTPDGYLWVGTYDGLARFDGKRFLTFHPGNTPALKHARIRSLSVDPRGSLWINAGDGSLTALRQGRFEVESAGNSQTDPDASMVWSSPDRVVFKMDRGMIGRKQLREGPGRGWEWFDLPGWVEGAPCCADGSGNVWYRGQSNELFCLAGDRLERLPPDPRLQDQKVRCLAIDSQGRLWIATDLEIARWDGKQFQDILPLPVEGRAKVQFLHISRKGDVLAVARRRVFRAVAGAWQEVKELRERYMSDITGMGAWDDRSGGVWLFDFGHGLCHVAANGQARSFGRNEGIPGDRVNCFFEDREGNWWVALEPGGLVRLREPRFQVLAGSDIDRSKPAKSVCEDASGMLWIGTLGNGLVQWRDSTNSHSKRTPGGTERGYVFSVCPDPSGRIWMSAGAEDLYLLDQGKVERWTPTVHGVKAILAEPDGRLWVGTKAGLFSSEPDPIEFKRFDDLGRREARALARDAAGRLWVGAGEGMLYRIAEGVVTAFQPDGAGHHAIGALLADADGTIWAGTFRGGLLRFRGGKFTCYTQAEGLPDNTICQILDDEQGFLWLGSQRGIFRVAKAAFDDYARGQIKSLPCQIFGRGDGLPSLECTEGYQPAAWRSRDGSLYFTTLKGVVSVKPGRIVPNLLPPRVIIEEVLVDDAVQSFQNRFGTAGETTTGQEAGGAGSTAGAAESPVLEIPPGKRRFEFRYTGINLAAPEIVQFRYRLEGVDGDWVQAGTRRFAQYNFLQPGIYRFRVAACNGDLVWSEAAATLALRVLPHFYETGWFRLLAGVMGVGVIAGMVHQGVRRRLRRQLEKLERQRLVEVERTRIAQDIHDDLGAGLTEIILAGSRLSREPALTSTSQQQLADICNRARALSQSMDEVVWAVNPRNDTLEGFLTYLDKAAQDMLRLANVRFRWGVAPELPALPLSAAVRHSLLLSCKEALHNAIKHAAASEVWIRLELHPAGFTLSVEDNGKGFDLRSRWEQGHGLVNMHKRLADVGGRCEIQTEPGAGTKVRFTLPARETGAAASSA